MKTSIYILTNILICLLLQFWLPWWVIVPVSYAWAFLFAPGKWYAFSGAFLSVFLLWCGMAIFAESRSDVSIAELLGNVLGNIPGAVVILITGLTGGICGGLGGLLGQWSKNLFHKNYPS